jgi:segregation and condensation protein A
VTFVAILELLREGLIDIVQSEAYAPLHVRAGNPAQSARTIEGETIEVVAQLDASLLASAQGQEFLQDTDGDAEHDDE